MCAKSKKYYITTAITYTSGKPHIGNTYEIVLADSIARYKRMSGYDVYFQTGTDEHGEKIEQNAKRAGITPKEFVDNVAGEIKRIWDLMDTTYDRFVRTTDPVHQKIVQKIFKKLYDQGDIYKGQYEGMYCTPCESFFTESQLIDGKCPDCGRPVHPAKEEAYFFKLSKYADRLAEHIENNPDFICPAARKNEMLNNFIKPGLTDLCVSRSSFKWGIPVSFDNDHVIYVWIDALSNYITFLGYDPDKSSEMYEKYWPADVHVIGKDIVRFHTIYWPILLMALGEPLPKQVFGHPWLIMSDGKMSKSKGNVIYADKLVDLFGVDAIRYYVLHEIPYANDGIISYELIIERINSELANILGNLVNRTITMSKKYFGGVVYQPVEKAEPDSELIKLCLKTPGLVKEHMDAFKISEAIDDIFALLRRSNKYIDETQPWILGKNGSEDRLKTVLYNLLECIRFSAILLEPFMPSTAKSILKQLNIENAGLDSLNSFGYIKDGHLLGEPKILFERLDAKKVLSEIEAQKETKAKDNSNTISIDDFAKIELKAAQIVACEPLEGSDKLLKIIVDNGSAQKQILSGIAKYYSPEDLIGKKIVLVDNLAPAKMRGTISEGMLLAADNPDKSVKVVFLSDDIENGAKIR
jgi:methionine--tRNA ligase